jgi:hypothetical protein
MSEEWWPFLMLVGLLLALGFLGVRQPRLFVRLIQIGLTGGFVVSALYALGRTLLGATNSVTGGLLFTAAAAGLALVSFHIFDWIIRSRFGE